MRLIPLAFAAACGAASADGPLAVTLGGSHDATERALRAQQFCLQTSSDTIAHLQQRQLYPRCDRAASEHATAWVVARYEGDRLVELRRLERFGDDNRAVERWNALVAARMKASAPSDDALAALTLEPGTRSVKGFRGEGDTVIGVYLLTPSPPDHASVLERITYAKN